MKITNSPVSVIIPAYNEADNIADVLTVLQAWHEASEIIVVNDGSSDKTAQVVRRCQSTDSRLVLHSLPHNQGKGSAMRAGVEKASCPIVLFIDADLKGLDPHHLCQLLEPVQANDVDMTVARFQHGRLQTSMMHRLLPFLSGQRCMSVSTFYALFDTKNKDWSVETAFNLHAWYYGYRSQYIPWEGVTHKMRPEKRRGISGYWSHIKMWWQISAYVSNFLLRQLYSNLLKHQLEGTASRKLASKAVPKQSR